MTASGLELTAPPAPGPGAAWRAGWRSFWARPEQVLVPVLAAGFSWVLAQLVVQIVISGTVTRSHSCVRNLDGLLDPTYCAADEASRETGIVLTVLAVCFFGQLFWAVALRTARRSLSTTPLPPARSVLGPVLATAAVLAVAVTLGLGLGVLPGVVIGFGAQFAMAGVVVEDRGCLSALRAGLVRVRRRPAAAAGSALLALLTLACGLSLGVVGVWPAITVIALAQVHLHRASDDLPES